MDRPTIEFVTTGGNKFVLYEYATGRDRRSFQEPFLRDVKLNPADKNIDSMIPMSATSESQDAVIRALVVSVNGSNKNVLEDALSLRDSEFNQLIDKLNSITQDFDNKKK